ncbi:hypothetical protein Tco_0592969 [Tanacetum coccineum]
MSTAEAEYVTLSACCAEVIWTRTQLLDYGFWYNMIPMYCDSKSEITISCNPVQHSRTKHINIRYHSIKEYVEKGTIELYFVGTEYQLADLFTKAFQEKDDIPLVSVYTTRNVLVQGMMIPDEFLTKEVCTTADFKEYETVFVGVDVPMN